MAASSSDSIRNEKYEIRDSSIAGVGIFAKRPFAAGACIIEEGCLVSASLTLFPSGELSLGPWAIEEAIGNLTATKCDSFRALHGWSVHHTWAVNEFRWKSAGSTDNDTSGVFPTISRVNHSCVPNAEAECPGGLGKIRAKQDIAEGDEIFISYKPSMSDDDDRRKREGLLKGFVCRCYACKQNMTIGQVRQERK